MKGTKMLKEQTQWKQSETPGSVKPEIRNFPRFSKFAQNLMHQIDLKCVAYGYPAVKIFWRKAGEHLNSVKYIFDNEGKTEKV